MDTTLPQQSSGPHVLPDAEIERLQLLEVALAALIAHAERLEELAQRDAEARRAA